MSKTKAMTHQFITISNKSVIPVDAPNTILIVPWGDVHSANGDFLVDEQSAQNIVAAFEEHGVLLPIDLEHQTLGGDEWSSPDGAAPAMGWITALSIAPGNGIVASVEWTDRGKALVESKEYRYLSPVLSLVRGSARVASLHSVALTNKPAIVRMVPIVNKQGNVPHTSKFGLFEDTRFFLGLDESADEEMIMNDLEVFLKKLRDLVPAAEGATQTEVMAALSERLKEGDEFRLAVCKSLGIEGGQAKSNERIFEMLESVTKAHSDTGKWVPREEFDVVAKSQSKLIEQNKALAEKITDREAGERIEKALKEKKLTPAQVDPESKTGCHYLALARDKDAWDAFMERQPVLMPDDGSILSRKRQGPSTALSGRGDPILAHSDRYDQDRLGEYEKIKAYQAEHKVSYEEAMEVCGT